VSSYYSDLCSVLLVAAICKSSSVGSVSSHDRYCSTGARRPLCSAYRVDSTIVSVSPHLCPLRLLYGRNACIAQT